MKLTGPNLALILLLTTGMAASAQETNAPARADFQSFRIIAERNIFNPNRSAGADRSRRRDREPPRRERIESFALVGTMSYEKGRFAFFDGTSSDYRRVLQTEDTIAGYKVAEIAPTHVKLESTNSQPIELHVGMQMKKRDEEEWQISSVAESFEQTSRTTTASEKPESAPSAEVSDVLKRLMEKREQELQK